MDDSIYKPAEELNESVDEILGEIMSKDGSFNSEFTELYAKYLGVGAGEITQVLTTDLSDRSDEPPTPSRVQYEDPDLVPKRRPDTSKRIAQRLPVGVREAFVGAEEKVKKPEFTSGGEVKYPSMGTGESEERVVFDADWEARAKEEAAKRESFRREQMLRGDSFYARSFVARGKEGYSPYEQHAPTVNPAFIDPLSDDDISYFEPADSSLTEKREQSLEEMFGRAYDSSDRKKKRRKI